MDVGPENKIYVKKQYTHFPILMNLQILEAKFIPYRENTHTHTPSYHNQIMENQWWSLNELWEEN